MANTDNLQTGAWDETLHTQRAILDRIRARDLRGARHWQEHQRS